MFALRSFVSVILPVAAHGASFAASYGDHMVLQQAPARSAVWGFTSSDAPLILTMTNSVSGHADTFTAVIAPFNGTAYTWRVDLQPTAATQPPQPYSLALSTGAKIDDVLFGEVWVCSGQSNMAFLVEMAFGGAELVQDANNHPDIRIFTTRKLTAGTPLQELGQSTNKGSWTQGVELPWSVSSNISISDTNHGANDDNWLYMSAVCYLFGKQIQAARKVPVGLINTNWGGTAIQDWCPAAAIQDCSHDLAAPLVATHLYNAMVSPLRNHTIKGVVWYQGESNGGDPLGYRCLLPALVRNWRAGWAEGSHTDPQFPFGVVQLAGDIGKDSLALPKFRFTGQTQNTGTLPNVQIPNSFLATAYDLGDSTSPYGSVHCRYKKEVGERLALGARRTAYGEKVHVAPVFQSAVLSQAADKSYEVTIKFSDPGSAGLAMSAMNISKEHDQTNWPGSSPFEVCQVNASSPGQCGEMGGFIGWTVAPASVLASNADTVTFAGLKFRPSAVRFAWRGYPCEHLGCGLYSKNEGIPPPPFHAWLNASDHDRIIIL